MKPQLNQFKAIKAQYHFNFLSDDINFEVFNQRNNPLFNLAKKNVSVSI